MFARSPSTSMALRAVTVLAPLMQLAGVALAISSVPANPNIPALTEQYCENKTVVNMKDMGVTSFNAHKYFSQVPVDGVCIFGTNSPDTIVGTVNDDVIFGFGGSDLIRGKAGRDTIYGGKGNDFIRGGKGNDKIIGGTGADYMLGGRDLDVMKGNSGDDTIYGKYGKDTIIGGAGKDILMGGRWGDVIRASSLDEVIGKCVKDIIHSSDGSVTYKLCNKMKS